MTTASELVPPLADAPTGRGSRAWPRFVAAFVLGILLCLGLAGAALLAYDAAYDGRVLPGVRVGDVDLSGLDRTQATAALAAAYGGYGQGRVVLRTPAGDVSVLYQQFSRRPDAEAMADEALRTGRSGGALERAMAEVQLALHGAVLEPRMTLDEATLAAGVADALSWLDRRPVDATIELRRTGFVTSPGRAGRTFDAQAASEAALALVRRRDAPAEVVVGVPAIAIPPTRTTENVEAARLAGERMVADVVVKFHRKTWTVKAATVRAALSLTIAPDGTIRPVVDETRISASLKKVAKAVKRKAVSATYLVSKSGRIFGVAPGADGRQLDREATTAAILASLDERASGAEPGPVGATVVPYQPKLTTEEAVKKAPLMTLLGSWKTWFPISERNYWGANIWLPALIIDGTVLRPGQSFEWWRAVGPVTSARGFGPGGFIAGDHTEPTGALGGGMCSSSTTLFNAALRAGLRMGARSNHRYYIDRYPLGLDATVSKTAGGGTQTLTFTNDLDRAILIRGRKVISGGVGWVVYEIWGTPDGRTVSIGRPAVANLRRATTGVVYVSTLPRGVREQTEYPSDGMDVAVTRVVRNAQGRVIHQETYRSHYTLWNGRIEVGR